MSLVNQTAGNPRVFNQTKGDDTAVGSQRMDERRALMQAWAGYLDALKAKSLETDLLKGLDV